MENAKMKLLKELKAENILPPEALDEASAGNCYEMADDSRFLNVLLRGRDYQPERFGATKCWLFNDKIGKQLAVAWASVGVVYRPDSSKSGSWLAKNVYVSGGKVIDQQEAFKIAGEAVGRHLEESDWKW